MTIPSTTVHSLGNNMATPPLRGRADEMKTALAQVDALLEGRGGALVIEGPVGSGKSRLLAEMTALAERRGVRTLYGEAIEHQQDVPFIPMFTAMLSGGRPVGNGEVLRKLGASADTGYWVVQHLQAAITEAAERSPLMVVLDDIHWADNKTLLALRSLAAALADVRVLWVLTMRTGAGSPPVHETLATLRDSGAEFLHLPAMSRGAVVEMVADLVRARVDESLEGMAAKARGNPYLVTEILRGVREEGRLQIGSGTASVTRQDLPGRLTACMQRRLDVLSTDASELVRVAAVLPERFSAGLLAAMLERQPASLLPALAESARAGLLVDDGEQLRFGHRLLREATRECLPQSLRRAMERQSASLMMSMGAPPADVAEALVRSAEPGDRAAAAALRGAAQSLARTDVSAAADFSMRALELLPTDDTDHGRLVAETVVLLNRARRYQDAEELAVTALAEATADSEAEIRLRLPAFTRHGSRHRAEENRRALRLDAINDVTRARHLALLAYNLMLDDADGRHRALADDALAAADAVNDLESKVIANVTMACFECVDGAAGAALDRLKELCARCRTSELPAAYLLSAAHYANALAAVGHVDESVDLITSRAGRARQEHNAMAVDVWSTYAGMAQLAAGELDAARLAAEAVPIPDVHDSTQPDVTELDVLRAAVLVEVALRTDDRKLLQQMLFHVRSAYAEGSAMERRTAAHALAMAAWYADDLDEAARWSDPEVELLRAPLTPQALDQVILRARVAAASGERDCRAGVLRAVEKLSGDEVPLFTAVVLHARGLLDADTDMLMRATDLLRSSQRPMLFAAATEDVGRNLADAERTDQALDWLNAAFDTYTRLGAVADARRVGRRLRQLGVERRITRHPKAKSGWDSLTDSEHKVVTLVAQGATNRAVADQLHLSLHTVKTHVHNAFGKLGISSRAQLVQAGR